nr:hypothetical protein [Tanacetum cinerariifolium]
MVKSSPSSKNEVFDDSFCSTSCKKNTKDLNIKITKLNEEVGDHKTMLYHYKLGLLQVEARLVEFKNQEFKFCENIRGLEFNVECKNNRIERLKRNWRSLRKRKKCCPPPAQVYSPPKKDMSWTGLPEFADNTITNYSRPTPSIKSNSSNHQSSTSLVSEHGESSSSIMAKPMIKFVKAVDCPKVKTNKAEAIRKPSFDQLAYDCGFWVEKGKTWAKNNYTHKSRSPKTIFHNTGRTPSVNRPNVNSARPKTTQELVIILIQRVKRLERELKERTPPTKIHKVDVRCRSRSVMAWVPKMV